jgi:hypothetical protein
MRAAARLLLWSVGFAVGLMPVVLVTLSLADAEDGLSGAWIMMALVPGLAALYAWDRHPYFAGGIASAVTILGGPLNPLLLSYGGWIRALAGLLIGTAATASAS